AFHLPVCPNLRDHLSASPAPDRRGADAAGALRPRKWRSNDGLRHCCARSTRRSAMTQSNALIRHF
ncbi:hypothetical protein, partial [Burkholderia pseudomallei]|uniref:hypothetical protein n=1 Tax=Burkholderia pseudomallei TaxID=28450 RepID=UPI0021BAA9AC